MERAVTRVLLVDDEALVRAGLRMILETTDDLVVVGEVDDGADALAAVRRSRPDVVLMDIRMPRTDGLSATAAICALPDRPAVIVLTTFDADDYVFRALRAGADGFLLKDTRPQELIRAVRLVAAGDSMLSPGVTRRLITHVAGDPRAERRRTALSRIDGLTDREREVLVEVGRGSTNAEIARTLHMSEATVKTHVSHLFDKLGVTNRVQVAIVAHDAGVTG
jgi:DNA-binding NarL/FixJ family response regulator